MKRIHQITGIALAAGLTLAASGALAQGGPMWGGGGGNPMYSGGYGPMWGGGPGAMHSGYGPMMGPHGGFGPGFGRGFGPGYGAGQGADFAERHLSALKGYLKITPEQEKAWNAYATKARENSEAMRKLAETVQTAPASAPERMNLMAGIMQQRAAAMQTLSAALKDLYAVLTPEQKAILDGGGFGPGGRGCRLARLRHHHFGRTFRRDGGKGDGVFRGKGGQDNMLLV